MSNIYEVLNEAEKIHPYKIQGQPDTYSKYNEGWSDAVDYIESRINEEWIPCSERLPEEDTWCLATAYDKSQKQWFVGEVYYSDGDWSDVYYDDIIVSAWMPVPEPYKSEEAERRGI